MIPYEEFRYGANTNYHFKASSENVKKTLLPQSLDTITNLRLDKNESHKTVTLHFPTEDLITITRLTRSVDNYGNRDGLNNHTILMRVSDYLAEHHIFDVFPPINLVEGLFEPLEVTI